MILVLDDGTGANEPRLGWVRIIRFAVQPLGLENDILVVTGDNLLDFSLREFIRYVQENQTTHVMRNWDKSVDKLRKTGVAVVDSSDCILEMEEKPTDPKNRWCIPPQYYYRAEDVGLVKADIDASYGTYAPGSFCCLVVRRHGGTRLRNARVEV